MNENKAALSPKKSESNCHALHDSSLEFGMPPAYSKKAATRNIKSLASCSNQLLYILSDLFISSLPEMRFSLKVGHYYLFDSFFHVHDIFCLCSFVLKNS